MNKEYVVAFAKKLLAIDSPTGYTKKAIDFVEEEAKRFGYQTKRNHKGNLWIYVKGNHHHKTLGLCAHCDTLGLMVRSIKSDGKLALTNLGGPIIPTLDGEYCRIYTR
ncbi:MAG: aminopeptidase, partial [Longicatena caecimuris]